MILCRINYLNQIWEIIIKCWKIVSYNTPDESTIGGGSHLDTSKTNTDKSNGTLILDVTKYTPFLTGLSVSISLIFAQLFGRRRLHKWNSEQNGTRLWRKRTDLYKKMSFDAYNESDGLVATVNGALKERGIIRNTLR